MDVSTKGHAQWKYLFQTFSTKNYLQIHHTAEQHHLHAKVMNCTVHNKHRALGGKDRERERVLFGSLDKETDEERVRESEFENGSENVTVTNQVF